MQKKLKIGFIGCGAIGSRLAKSVQHDLKEKCVISGLYDLAPQKPIALAKRLGLSSSLIKKSLAELIRSSDFIVEAIASNETTKIIQQVVGAHKGILIMSVGKVLDIPHLFRLAEKTKTTVLIPSGAIAGLDVIKAVGANNITRISLTTRKPPSSLSQTDHLSQKGIFINKIKNETVIFDGSVDRSIALFPRNINVAAALALASGARKKIRVRIITSPKFRLNSHEITVEGKFGSLSTHTHNLPCPDNPKTSYLAVLSALQTLKQYFQSVKIGT